MAKWLILALVMATQSAASSVPAAGSSAAASDQWQAQATKFDIDRLEQMAATRAAAIEEARGEAGFSALQPLLNASSQPIDARSVLGRWKCRTIKLGGSFGSLTVYPFFKCEISERSGELFFSKDSGSQRLAGQLFAHGGDAYVFLGGSYYDYESPKHYGQEQDRNEIGLLRKLGTDWIVLELPKPLLESNHNIIELRRD